MLQSTLFESQRMTLGESLELTVASLEAYGRLHRHWAVAWSGGKDSSALLTVVLYLLKSGRIAPPERLTVLYADTRMELPPLAHAASRMISRISSEGIETRVAVAPMDKRFFVYLFGRGVPPPNNSTFRWCTRQIKVDPMHAELERLASREQGKILMLTGVRIGESAQRDNRIALSCGKNGAECGQGWYQETLRGELCDTLAPILHWRTCLVWDWLTEAMPSELRHGYPTHLVAEAYGVDAEGSEAEKAARTGCVGCPLATVDSALDNLLARSTKWSYLEPIKDLRPLYRWLREPSQRLRKPGFEQHAGGALRYTNRMGPLTMAARRQGLATVLDIQARCNASSPVPVDILNPEEVARIEQLIALNTWPQKWDGTEARGDEPFERVFKDGSKQCIMTYTEKFE